MSDGWSNLEDKLKKIQEKQTEEASNKPSETIVEDKPPEKQKPARKGAFKEYMEKVQGIYKDSKIEPGSRHKDKYESMFDNIETPKLHKPMAEERPMAKAGKKQFKGMEKRFLQNRKL
ncbi:MAG: hypothetical protein ABH834_01740 [Candidatus Altiarchaeota archaeon]